MSNTHPLKRGRWATKSYIPNPKDFASFMEREDPATYCPLLYAKDDNEWVDDGPVGPFEIRTAQVDFGDDLTDGILAIDGARAVLNRTMKELRKVKFLDIKDALSKLLMDWRDYLSRKLQYFVNMLVFPLVGCHKEKVRIHFDSCWLEPREFMVDVKPKDKRSTNAESGYLLRSV